MNYFVAQQYREDTDAYIKDLPPDLEDMHELLQGVARADTWPDSIVFPFSQRHPEGMNLTDALSNVFGWLIVDEAFKKVLEGFDEGTLEYLPVSITNHKGRLASDAYWIVNLLTLTEGVDRARSDFEADAFYADRIAIFERLVLTEEIQANGPPVFRLKERARLLLMRADVVEAIEQAGLTGLRFIPVSEYHSYL